MHIIAKLLCDLNRQFILIIVRKKTSYMAEEPPVSNETPTPENPTPTPKKSHTGLIVAIVLIVIVVLLALFFGLYFGLRNKGDTPDDPTPDPEIEEPGPVEEPEHTHEYGGWQYDDTYHWKECECGDVIDKAEHTLGEEILGEDGYYQTCSVCGYSTEPVTPIAASITVTYSDSLSIHYNNSNDDSSPETLNLRDTITVTVLDQFNNEYTGDHGSEYTLSTVSSEISLDAETGVVTGVSEGTAIVTVTSVANTSLTKDIEIEVSEKEYKVESISASIEGETSSNGNIILSWGATSGELQVTFNPTYATIQTYSVASTTDDGLFTYNETDKTFTHTSLNTGTETFTITATDESYSASTTITLECDPVIDEPYEVVWKTDDEHVLPETIAKGESIDNLDKYVDVLFNHEGQVEHEYEDDSYTLSFAGSTGVTISGTTATFTGDGGTTAYITVTATPDHDTGNPVYAQSSNITITQAVTGVSLNYSEYIFKPLTEDTSVDLEVTFSPNDYYPKDQITDINWTITGDDSNYLTLTTDEDDATECTVSVDSTNWNGNNVYVENIIVTATINSSKTASCNFAILNPSGFASDSWEIINKVSSLGIASEVDKVGDTKTITIGSESHDIRIIDFDHDELTTTDENYDPNYNDGVHAGITCDMVDCLSTTHNMNSTNTNSGGWKECKMRSYLNSDSECVLSTLDNDLQSVIKKVDKVGLSSGNQTESFTTSSDSLFLLSEKEVSTTTSGSGLKDEGSTYAYWSVWGNSTIKYRSGDADGWWLRSPSTSSSTTFCYVGYSGTLYSNGGATFASGVSFAFCV